MNPEIKVKWLEALRSGKYKQTKYVLKNNIGHCCLGVLCDIIDPNGWDKKLFDNEAYGFTHKGNWNTRILPQTIMEETNLDKLDKLDTLVAMNDFGNSFNEIANFIEKEL